jgi:dihydrofolate reductase
MSKVRANISVSIDGYVAGPNQTLENPLGEGGESLHDWLVVLRSWREQAGMDGGEEGLNNDVFADVTANVGTEIMGRGKFGPPGGGPWGDDAWKGWWGDDPPFRKPVFVVTHHEREPLTLTDTTFTFVTDGIESALAQGREAAGGRDVFIGGGADIINRFLSAGLLDELGLHVVPIVLGGGSRLFAGVSPDVKLQQIRSIEGPGVTHVTYRVVK